MAHDAGRGGPTNAHETVSRARAAAARWTPGTALLLIGLVHLATGPVFYPDSLRSLVEGGVVAAVEADPALLAPRAAGFWYLTAGLGMVTCAVLMRSHERRGTSLPRSLPWLLAGTGLWGALLMPVSGFWALLAVAAWVFARGAAAARVR